MTTNKKYKYVLPEGYVLKGGECDYVVEGVLGKGGFGVTYKVKARVQFKKIKINAYFAVKEYFPEICSRENDNTTIKIPETKLEEVSAGIQDFINEGRRLQQVCELNPNIVDVNEVFEANGTAYYVLEYLEGGDLRKMVKDNGGGLTEQQMLNVMTPIAHAVQCLHDNNMLHLDIKPDNIVMRRDHDGGGPDVPVLIDFGIAAHFNEEGTPTSKMPSQGISAGYSPIEQYSRITNFDPRIDVYAFSATCLYLLTGKDPVESLSRPANFVREVIPSSVSEHVTKAIEHGMSKDGEQRTASINELLANLNGNEANDIKDTKPASIPPLPIPTRDINRPKISTQNQPVQRQQDKKQPIAPEQVAYKNNPKNNNSKFIIFAILGALLIGGIVTYFVLTKSSKKSHDDSETENVNTSLSAIDESAAACADTLQQALNEYNYVGDGARIVYAARVAGSHPGVNDVMVGITQKTGEFYKIYKLVKKEDKWTIEPDNVKKISTVGYDVTFDQNKMMASRDIIPMVVDIGGKKYFFYAFMKTHNGDQSKAQVVLNMYDVETSSITSATYEGVFQNIKNERVIVCSPASGSGDVVKWMNETARNFIRIIRFNDEEQPASKEEQTKPAEEEQTKPVEETKPAQPENSAVTETKDKDESMFSIDDVTKTVQAGNFKVMLLRNGSVVSYNISTGKNSKIQSGGAKDIGFYDIPNCIISIRNNDDTRKRVNLNTGQIVNVEAASQPEKKEKKKEEGGTTMP